MLNFCAVAMALNDFGYKAIGIRIDSGDLAYLSRVVKESMDRVATNYEMEWFSNMVITASNDINEETILSLNEQGHKITAYGKITKLQEIGLIYTNNLCLGRHRNPSCHLSAPASSGMCLQVGGGQWQAKDQAVTGCTEGDNARAQGCLQTVQQ